MKHKLITYLGAMMAISVLPSIALAFSYTYPIDVFTNNGTYAESDELSLSVQASNRGTSPNIIDFTITNQSTISSSIAAIYFDFDDALSFNELTNGAGVTYRVGAKPPELPSGHTLEPIFDSEYSFGSNSPKSSRGINPGEQVLISFDLYGSATDLIDNMNAGLFRIGAHIIALPDGSSETAATIPEPATIAILGLGALLIRKKRNNK